MQVDLGWQRCIGCPPQQDFDEAELADWRASVPPPHDGLVEFTRWVKVRWIPPAAPGVSNRRKR